jgi:hypothetical protein
VEATLILCDSAEAVQGKLYVLGGGWTHARAAGQPFNLALGIVVRVPWDQANEQYELSTVLVTADGEPVSIGPAKVEQALRHEVGRPPGLKRGTSLNAVFAFRFDGLVLEAGGYVWEVFINREPKARTPFWIVSPPS